VLRVEPKSKREGALRAALEAQASPNPLQKTPERKLCAEGRFRAFAYFHLYPAHALYTYAPLCLS